MVDAALHRPWCRWSMTRRLARFALEGPASTAIERHDPTYRLAGRARSLKHVVILIQDPWLGLGWSVPDTLIVIAFLAVPAALTSRFLR